MIKKSLILGICFFMAGCSSKDELQEQQAHMYNEFKSTNSAGSMFRIADSMKKAGNIDTAISLYQQALQADPTFIQAYISLSQCYRYTGRPEASLETLKSVPAGDKSKEYYKEMANVMNARQSPKECVSNNMKAYELDSSDIGTINGIAVCHDIQGQHLQAQTWYKKAIALAPAHDKLRSNYGLSLALSGNTQEAIKVLKNVVYGPGATSKDRQNLAIAYGLDGQMDQAAKLFSQDLDEADVRTNLAFVHKFAQTQKLAKAQQSKEPSVVLKEDLFQTQSEGIKTEALKPVTSHEIPAKKASITPEDYIKALAARDLPEDSAKADVMGSKLEETFQSGLIDETKNANIVSEDKNISDLESPLASTTSASQGFIVSQELDTKNEETVTEHGQSETKAADFSSGQADSSIHEFY